MGQDNYDWRYGRPLDLPEQAHEKARERSAVTSPEKIAKKGVVSKDEEREVRGEIRKMRRGLAAWLKYRKINDEIATGKRKGKRPPGIAKQAILSGRSGEQEQKLATDLYNLLSQLHDPSALPNPSLAENPLAAVSLAQIAIKGKLAQAENPQAQGFIPILILTIGGVVALSLVSFINNRAKILAEQERMKCIREGDWQARLACTPTSTWVAIGAIGFGAWWLTKGGGRKAFR